MAKSEPDNFPDINHTSLGRRKNDPKVYFDWHRKRAALHANLAYIQDNVIFLEPIHTVPERTPRSRNQFGILLINRMWGNQFFALNMREGWNEEDYFKFADGLIKAHLRKKGTHENG